MFRVTTMKKRALLTVCLISLYACSGGSSSKDDNNSADTGPDQSTVEPDAGNNGTTEDAANNATPSDLGRDEGLADMPADDGVADMSSDMADVFEFPDVADQNCFYPTTDPNCPTGEYGPATFLDHIEIDESRACCRDFDGDGVVDNKIGQYVGILRGTGQDVNGNIDAAVRSGRLAYLFEYENWANDTFDPSLGMRTYLGADDDFDFTDNLAGTGQFLTLPESYQMDGSPRWEFASASVNNGHLVAEGGELELYFPGLLDAVQMVVRDVRVEADVVAPADLAAGGAVTLDNGEISGALDRDLFYESMNEAAVACDCLQKPAFAYEPAMNEYVCALTQEDQDACNADPLAAGGCQFLADRMSCQFLELVSSDLDLDFDGDGTLDSFSVGVKFTGVGARIVGEQ